MSDELAKLVRELHEEVLEAKDEVIEEKEKRIQEQKEIIEDKEARYKNIVGELNQRISKLEDVEKVNQTEIQGGEIECPFCSDEIDQQGLSTHCKHTHGTSMKEWYQTEEGHFLCIEDGEEFENWDGLRQHLKEMHRTNAANYFAKHAEEADLDQDPSDQPGESKEDSGLYDEDGNFKDLQKPRNLMDLSMNQTKAKILEFFEEEFDVAKTIHEVAEEIWDLSPEELNKSSEYNRLWRCMTDMRELSSFKGGNNDYYYETEEQKKQRKQLNAKEKVINNLGDNEYQLRRHAVNKLLPEPGEEVEVEFLDLGDVYAGDREYSKRDFWQFLCTKGDFHQAMRYDLDDNLEFVMKNDKDSKDPMQQYTLYINRGEDQ